MFDIDTELTFLLEFHADLFRYKENNFIVPAIKTRTFFVAIAGILRLFGPGRQNNKEIFMCNACALTLPLKRNAWLSTTSAR